MTPNKTVYVRTDDADSTLHTTQHNRVLPHTDSACGERPRLYARMTSPVRGDAEPLKSWVTVKETAEATTG